MDDRAMRLSDEADQRLRSGDRDGADRLYIEAAEAERRSFEATASDRPRARSLLAASHVSLLYSARRFANAASAADDYLSDPVLRDWNGDDLMMLRDRSLAFLRSDRP